MDCVPVGVRPGAIIRNAIAFLTLKSITRIEISGQRRTGGGDKETNGEPLGHLASLMIINNGMFIVFFISREKSGNELIFSDVSYENVAERVRRQLGKSCIEL